MIISIEAENNKKEILYIYFFAFVLLEENIINTAGILDSDNIYSYIRNKKVERKIYADEQKIISETDIVFDFSKKLYTKANIRLINHLHLINKTNNIRINKSGISIIYDYIYKYKDSKTKLDVNSYKKIHKFKSCIYTINYDMEINNMIQFDFLENEYYKLYKQLKRRNRKRYKMIAKGIIKEFS